MQTDKINEGTNRRNFLGTLALGAAGMGLSSFAPSIHELAAEMKFDQSVYGDPEEMFKKINGKRKVVYDCVQPHEIFPFAWPRVFLVTNAATGTPAKDCSVVVVLRHSAIGYAFNDDMWKKYKFGNFFKANEIGPTFKAADAATATSVRNPFWKPQSGDFVFPGIGAVPIGISDLQADGVMFCVCNAAMTVYSTVAAGQMNLKPEDVKKEWEENLIKDITVVPSGVWALGRAQEKGCAYIYV